MTFFRENGRGVFVLKTLKIRATSHLALYCAMYPRVECVTGKKKSQKTTLAEKEGGKGLDRPPSPPHSSKENVGIDFPPRKEAEEVATCFTLCVPLSFFSPLCLSKKKSGQGAAMGRGQRREGKKTGPKREKKGRFLCLPATASLLPVSVLSFTLLFPLSSHT